MSGGGVWDEADEVVHFGFAEQVEAARNGWLQGRYYSEEGDTVADVLSFRNVFEINPFVVGVSYARERRIWTPVLGVHHDNAGRLHGAADGKLFQGGTSRVGLNGDKSVSAVEPNGMFSNVRHLCNLAAKTHEASVKFGVYAHYAACTRSYVIRRDSNSFVDNFTLFTFNFTLFPNGAGEIDSVEISLRKSRYLHEVTGSWRR